MSYLSSDKEGNTVFAAHEKSENTKFSLILPVYNVEPYLKKCLESIINQSFKDFEVICVNDGSTDNSLEILNNYAANDNRFIIISQENQGQGIARNSAIKMAKGDYIVFIDPDDWIEPVLLENVYKTSQITDSDIIEFDYCEFNSYSGDIKKHNFKSILKKKFNCNLDLVPYYSYKDVKNYCLSKSDMHIWTKAYKREFINKIGAEFSPSKCGEDHLFAAIVILNANKIYHINKCLYTYRCRTGSSTNKLSNDNFAIFDNLQSLRQYLIEHNFYEELKEDFSHYKTNLMLCHYNNIPKDNLEKYKAKCKEYLTHKEYLKLLYKIKKYNSFWEFIFSVKNEREFGIKRKVVTIAGIKIYFNRGRKPYFTSESV